MTNELDQDEYIEQFVPGGSKYYAYKTINTKTLETKTFCKVRWITLNYATAQIVNFNIIRTMILVAYAGYDFTVHTDRKIKRKIKRCDGSGAETIRIVSEPEEVYIVFFTSAGGYTTRTLPFGYIKDEQGGSGSQYLLWTRSSTPSCPSSVVPRAAARLRSVSDYSPI